MLTPAKASKEQVARIVELYSELKSAPKVGALVGMADYNVVVVLKAQGVFKDRREVTPEEREQMVKWYTEDKLSTWQIATKLGYLNVCVINNLKKTGLILRDRSTAAKTYSVDQDYFKEIDTPVKAYILGLIWADGNMSKDSFTLALKESDKDLLEQIRLEIKSTGPLNFRKMQNDGKSKSNMWALRIHDKFFVQNLKDKGVVERKTSKLSYPSFLKEDFDTAFILGVCDGDGCISHTMNPSEKFRYRLGFSGSETMMLDLQRIIFNKLACKGYFATREYSKGCTLDYSATQGLSIMNWLYGSKPKFFLARKFDKYKFIANHLNKNNRIHPRTCKELKIANEIISHAA